MADRLRNRQTDCGDFISRTWRASTNKAPKHQLTQAARMYKARFFFIDENIKQQSHHDEIRMGMALQAGSQD